MKPDEFITARKSLGLTQEQLGEALGLSARAIRHYESGSRSIPKLVSVAIKSLRPHERP
jgi:transcriptional regulator with XRE-family HTH domain